MRHEKIYTRQVLIDALKAYAQEHGVPPTKRQLNADTSMPSDMAYRKEFGSWGNALLECGFIVPKPYPSEKCKQAVSKAKKGKTGELSPVWKGGRRVDEHGYVRVWNEQKQKYEREHRVIMEKHLGRELRSDEDVHHINGCKTDNRIENLLVLTRSEHSSLHEELGHHNQSSRVSKTCIFPGCECKTSSIHSLCRHHYKLQWQRLKEGRIADMSDVRIIPRRHTEETKRKLSEMAKKQPRMGGRFCNIHDNPPLLK